MVCPGNGNETIGLRALRRLTIPEFEATIRAAFGLDAKQWPGLTVPPDTGSEDGFTNNVDKLLVSPDYAKGGDGLQPRGLGAGGSADPVLTRLLPCAATGGPACAETFVTTFGPKLYRRPLTPAEKARYLACSTRRRRRTSSPSSTGRRRRCCSRRTSSTAASWVNRTAAA